ncbi:MAG: hypothetical protein ABR552_09150 [Actinomycetota bacterium]|nr:hypothetical protein [Actinomycetota bacterium]
MPLLRRRADPARERLRAGFRATVTHVDAAQRALIAAVPMSRDPGVPLAQAIEDMSRHLDAATTALESWHDIEQVHEWTKCRAAILEARAGLETLDPEEEMGFEALNARIGEVIAPLDIFADVSAALRR